MKLVMDCENEHFEMECKAAYVVIMDPEDSSSDITLAVMGRKTCAKCGKEFQVKRSSTRELCLECKSVTTSFRTKQHPVNNSAREEKMRKIKASGMTYGQYMANRGIKPEEPAAYRGTLPETQSWMQGPKTIEIHPDAPPPKARIKRKV